MADLLDAVPDSVLICTQPTTESKAIQSVYANFKMNSFFGRDVICTKKRNKLSSAKSKDKHRSRKDDKRKRKERNPLRQRIFTKQEIDFDTFENFDSQLSLESMKSVKEQVSLLDIVSLSQQKQRAMARKGRQQADCGEIFDEIAERKNSEMFVVSDPNPYSPTAG